MDAASNVSTYVYDNLGRRIQVTDALTNTVYTHYSPEGQVLATWGATYPVAYDFDEYGRMIAMYTYRGTNALSSYSEINTLKSSMDRTRWLYDETTGLLTNKVYSDGMGPRYTYTPDGKLQTRTWARGVVTTYNYDSLGQLTNISYSDNTPAVTFAFDRLGRQTTITDGAGTRLFSYTEAFQLASETNAAAELVRIYDSQGRPAGCDLVMAGSTSAVSTIRYSHDEVGRFHQVDADLRAASLPLQNFRYGYLADTDLIESLNETNIGYGVSRSFESRRNLITQMLNTSGTNRISQFDYVNDAVGRRTQRIDSSFLTNDFSYNTRNELIEALMGANNFSYRYDSIGNRTAATNNGVVTEYQANSLNQYSQITNNLQPITPSFDLDGNMTSYGQWAFAWDAENRMTGASSTSTVANYSYDYMSRRQRKVVNGVTNNFVYDGWNLISEISVGGSESITNNYVWGLDLSGTQQGAGGIGGLLSVTRNGTSYFPCYDANGNITDYVDSSGAVVAHREYDAYGNTVASSGPMVNDFSFWFSSKYLDHETGLYYYGLRYLMPETGRWTARDPIEEKGGENLLGFLANDSINRVDPLGLTWSSRLRDCVRASSFAIRIWDPSFGYGPHIASGLDASLDADKCACVCEFPRFRQQVRFSLSRRSGGSYLIVTRWMDDNSSSGYYNAAPGGRFSDAMSDMPTPIDNVMPGPFDTGKVELFTEVVCTQGSAAGTTIKTVNWGSEVERSFYRWNRWRPVYTYSKTWWPSGPYPRSF